RAVRVEALRNIGRLAVVNDGIDRLFSEIVKRERSSRGRKFKIEMVRAGLFIREETNVSAGSDKSARCDFVRWFMQPDKKALEFERFLVNGFVKFDPVLLVRNGTREPFVNHKRRR